MSDRRVAENGGWSLAEILRKSLYNFAMGSVERAVRGCACERRRRIYLRNWHSSLTDTCVYPKRSALNPGSRRFAITCAQEECRPSSPGTISRRGVGKEVS